MGARAVTTKKMEHICNALIHSCAPEHALILSPSGCSKPHYCNLESPMDLAVMLEERCRSRVQR
jgi:hypothetical protein